MVGCEMCGKGGELVDAIVEGAMMRICLDCSKHGNVIAVNQPVVEKQLERRREEEATFQYVDIIKEDFPDRIKRARERRGMKQEDLAKAIAEKESVIHQLETGRLKPSFKLAKKISVFLAIDLVESVEQSMSKKEKSVNFGDKAVTIGDILKKVE
ncbi:MAG: multiprotein bridging factor aMBF1 [Candidatus Woesearchaeota archaeon]